MLSKILKDKNRPQKKENDGNSQEKDRKILLIDSIWIRIETLVVTCNQNVALISFDCRASRKAKRKMKIKR